MISVISIEIEGFLDIQKMSKIIYYITRSVICSCVFFLVKTPLFPPDFSIRYISEITPWATAMRKLGALSVTFHDRLIYFVI